MKNNCPLLSHGDMVSYYTLSYLARSYLLRVFVSATNECAVSPYTTYNSRYSQANMRLTEWAYGPANDCSMTSRTHENMVVDPVTYVLETIFSCPVRRKTRDTEHCKSSSHATENVSV